MTAKFSHPHIVTVHGVGEHRGVPYVALEFLDGLDLGDRIVEQEPSVQESLRIMRAVASAVAEAHRHGVLHLGFLEQSDLQGVLHPLADPPCQSCGCCPDPCAYGVAGPAKRAQDRACFGVPLMAMQTEKAGSRNLRESAAICARGVTRDFQAGQQTITVLHGIDVDIRAGELTFLVGESGSGKTTLISIMCGILWPTQGEVKVFGTDIYELDDTALVEFRLNNIGFIFQQYNLIPSIDVASNAAVPLIAQGMDRGEARERAVAMLEKLNIADQADKLPNQLSGGQQQRVAIARSLVHEPRLVVCDEPTAALDASSGRRVMDLLREVAVAEDRACIIVTHDNRIFDLADRILVLEDGRITHDGKDMPEGH